MRQVHTPMPEPIRLIRCLMKFEQIFAEWRVTVLRDGRTIRELTFADQDKIEEMARRGGGLRNSEAKSMLELALRQRNGATELYLTDEQYDRLIDPKR